MTRAALLGLAAWTMSCEFPRPADVEPPEIDAPAAECEAGTKTCASDRYTECGADGRFVQYAVPSVEANQTATTLVMRDYACPLGCHATEARCLDVLPVNGLEAALDAPDVGPEGLDLVLDDLSGPATIIGIFDEGQDRIAITETDGTTTSVPAQLVPQPNALPIIALKVRSFTLRAGAHLRIASVDPIAILSHFDVAIAGHLDYSGSMRPSGMTRTGCDVDPATTAMGGGGNDTAGGASSTGSPGGASLATVSPELVPLEGGCRSWAATGGGGMQIVSRTRIRLLASGVVNVSGRRGVAVSNGTTTFVTGGGAGGSVLLEAPGIGFAPGAIVNGRGGSGAAANVGSGERADGLAGDADPTASSVPGATCNQCGRGGDGGTEMSFATAGSGTQPAVAGGGGAVGRCVTRTGAIGIVPAAVMKIHHTSRLVSTR